MPESDKDTEGDRKRSWSEEMTEEIEVAGEELVARVKELAADAQARILVPRFEDRSRGGQADQPRLSRHPVDDRERPTRWVGLDEHLEVL